MKKQSNPPPSNPRPPPRRPRQKLNEMMILAPPPTFETRFNFDSKYDMGMPIVIFIMFLTGIVVGVTLG